jgi:hypothetical protein
MTTKQESGGPERMVTGPARDALIDLFAERYPEPGTPEHAFEREIADTASLREPGSPRTLPARVADAFFGRSRTRRTR